MNAGPLRRVGYSFVGLLAGDIALLFLLVAHFVSQALVHPTHDPMFGAYQQASSAVEIWPFASVLVIAGWVVVGIPAVLFISSRTIRQEPWWTLLPLCAAMGPFAILFTDVLMSPPEVPDFDLTFYGPICLLAGFVSGIAFFVHCSLIKHHAA
jgi:hypothetical protein